MQYMYMYVTCTYNVLHELGGSLKTSKKILLLLTFRPDALVIFRAKGAFTLALKATRASSRNVSELFSFKLVFREPPSSIILEPAENRSLH